MKLKYFFFLCLLFLILNSAFLTATIRYVSKSGTSTPPYTTWQTAADSIQKCINICVNGDTIYVANGVYKEQVVMIPGLSLIGAGMDSCVVDTRDFIFSTGGISIKVADSCLLEGFLIVVASSPEFGRGIGGSGGSSTLVTLNRVTNAKYGIFTGGDVIIYKNVCDNISSGIYVFNSNSLVRKNIINVNIESVVVSGIRLEAFDNSYKPLIDSNYIETIGRGIDQSFGSRPTITNNTIVTQIANEGISPGYSDSANVFNNLIISKVRWKSILNYGVQHLELYHNYITGNVGTGMVVGPDNIVKNNVITNANTGFEKWSNQPEPLLQFNNVWDTGIISSGFNIDSTNLSVDPMIVNDDTIQGELDFHLQKFSPLIDAGDPNILDRDGSRSDIGLYGGPYGWTYTYNDLAPRPPHNVTAVNENGLIKLTWNKNTETDFSHYRIYRDTLSILIYDSTRIVGTTSDTLFYDNLPPSNTEKNYYYLITAFDNQGNQSAPSEEIIVTVTGLSEHPPKGFDNYALLSNYPNPFNPSTIIPYRLKEGGYVKLYIYDMKGELVKTLVNQWQASGYYEVVFQPNADERKKASSLEVPMGRTYSDMSSGVYLYQILVRGEGDIPVFSDMGKMILLK